jgi:hypothetical protein
MPKPPHEQDHCNQGSLRPGKHKSSEIVAFFNLFCQFSNKIQKMFDNWRTGAIIGVAGLEFDKHGP